jgi:hypothetical protein
MKAILALLFLFVSWSSFADVVRIDPAYLGDGLYNVQTDDSVIVPVQAAAAAGIGPCTRYTPIGVACFCNQGVLRARESPGWIPAGGAFRLRWTRPGWHVTNTRGMHSSGNVFATKTVRQPQKKEHSFTAPVIKPFRLIRRGRVRVARRGLVV